MDENENLRPDVSWLLEKGKIDEDAFCKMFVERHPLICINGVFYDYDGVITDESVLAAEINSIISEFVKTSLSMKIKNIIDLLRIYCRSDALPLYEDRIFLKNGTLYLDGRFEEEKCFCMNRLNINYSIEHKSCPVWLKFIDELFYEEDIPAVQEYLGYLLIPSTRGQKMMIIKGEGGEGKSRIGIVLKKIFGASLYTGSLQKVENSPFARACLEDMLVFLDDDLKLGALPDTNYIKSIVTAEEEMDVEKKGKQSYQSRIYSRLLAFGNGFLVSLYDRSMGFFRRQLIISTKPVPEDRVNDPFLADKMCEEAEQIFWWMLAGLWRLIKNNYRFTESERSIANREEAMKQGSNYEDFAESEGYIEFAPDYVITSQMLVEIYKVWCHENGAKLGNTQSMLTFFKNNSGKYGITPSNKIKIKGETRKVRGFKGMRPCFTRYPSGNAGLGPVAYSTNVTIEDTSYDDD